MAVNRRVDKDTAEKKIEDFVLSKKPIPVPEGVTLETKEQQLVWEQFSQARSIEDWRKMDLLLLVKVVKNECKIREYQERLEFEGVTLANARGTPTMNPLFTAIDILQRTQLSIIRSMSLNSTPESKTSMMSRADAMTKTKAIIEELKGDPYLAAH